MAAICDNILCNYRCHGSQLNTTRLCLTEGTKEAQSDAPRPPAPTTFDTIRLTDILLPQLYNFKLKQQDLLC